MMDKKENIKNWTAWHLRQLVERVMQIELMAKRKSYKTEQEDLIAALKDTHEEVIKAMEAYAKECIKEHDLEKGDFSDKPKEEPKKEDFYDINGA